MCTGFIRKGNDTIIGYNLDVDTKVWNYKIISNKNLFTVAIKVGSTTYYTHGVNKNGQFGVLPYMNDANPFVKLRGLKRIDLLVNNYIRNKLSFEQLKDILEKDKISNVKFGSLHALFAYKSLQAYICEPGCPIKKITKNYEVITNYPLLKECDDDNVFYGKDRYKVVDEILKESKDDFSWQDGLEALKKVSQQGQYATRLSFVYSVNENSVYYVLSNDFDHVLKQEFGD